MLGCLSDILVWDQGDWEDRGYRNAQETIVIQKMDDIILISSSLRHSKNMYVFAWNDDNRQGSSSIMSLYTI
jgi:hypothetical protein